MSTTKKKRNHWVPQAYLRPFAAEPAAREKIWTLGLQEGDPQLRPIKKVAVKFYLYAPGGPVGRDYSFEDKLASLECLFGMPQWKALCSSELDLNDPHLRKGVALLAATMFLRNPLQLKQNVSIHRQLVDFVSSHAELPGEFEINGKSVVLGETDWPAFRDADEEAVKSMWLKTVGSAAWLAEIFMEMRWAVVVSETPAFITTDNPVVAIHEELRFRGIRNRDTTIVFPISPTRVLNMDWRREEPNGAYYRLNGTAAAVNSLMWRNAYRDMFSSRHPDEVCAEIAASGEVAA